MPAAVYLGSFSPCSGRFDCKFEPKYTSDMSAKPRSLGRMVDQAAAQSAVLTCDAEWRIGSSVKTTTGIPADHCEASLCQIVAIASIEIMQHA